MRPNGRRKIVRPRFSAPIAPSASIDAIVTSTTSPAFEIVVSARMFGVTRPTRFSPGFARSSPATEAEPVAAADLRAEQRRELDEDLAEAAGEDAVPERRDPERRVEGDARHDARG